MLTGGAAAFSIILTTFMVNLRHVLMSSSLAVFLGGTKKRWLAVFAYGITDESFAVNYIRFKTGQWDLPRALVLNHATEKAKGAGLNKMALMVAIDNQDARRFYEDHGFKTTALHLESNKRVPYLGPGVQRMAKTISN